MGPCVSRDGGFRAAASRAACSTTPNTRTLSNLEAASPTSPNRTPPELNLHPPFQPQDDTQRPANMLPLGLLNAAQGHPMLVELKNGETLNGHLVLCDTWMNLTLREVVQTSPEGDKFVRLPEVYVKGNNIKYLQVQDEILDIVKEQQQNQQGGYRGGRGGQRGDHGGRGGDRGRGGRGQGRGRGRGGRGS
ncbi:hypothetical protein B0T18DRAFT_415750 [Schizothecium vesticola]|uniref:LSM complex subunit LSM4 n=1 Tax=Schizothecium vesticola TaxID=314040 RepID=A0AA40K2N7_9PEZI|nr:hypothetical protein B0T18DRAFT_415750 [Schizothecium vesticola]